MYLRPNRQTDMQRSTKEGKNVYSRHIIVEVYIGREELISIVLSLDGHRNLHKKILLATARTPSVTIQFHGTNVAGGLEYLLYTDLQIMVLGKHERRNLIHCVRT